MTRPADERLLTEANAAADITDPGTLIGGAVSEAVTSIINPSVITALGALADSTSRKWTP
jgi:hypothetical protein